MQLTSLLAQLPDPATLAILIPIISILFVLIITVVAILTSHQQKMTKLIHGGQEENQVNGAVVQELQSMRAEVARLREVVNHQVLAQDDRPSFPRTDVAERLRQEN